MLLCIIIIALLISYNKSELLHVGRVLADRIYLEMAFAILCARGTGAPARASTPHTTHLSSSLLILTSIPSNQMQTTESHDRIPSLRSPDDTGSGI